MKRPDLKGYLNTVVSSVNVVYNQARAVLTYQISYHRRVNEMNQTNETLGFEAL